MKTTAAVVSPITVQQKFDVLVIATMSAGKSTLINALIGYELLHTANEATTACHTRIEHKRGARFFTGTGYSYSDQILIKQRNISAEQVRDWNANKKIKRIALTGNFKSGTNSVPDLVLHDTPGPNNSQDIQHAKLAYETFESVPFKILLYVLNASQLGTQDDYKLLESLREATARKSGYTIFFILNKIDLLDTEKGEDLGDFVKSTQFYLERIGFVNPIIIPSIASAALYAKKILANEVLTRKQHIQLKQALYEFRQNKQTLLNATHAPASIKKQVLRHLKTLEKAHTTGLSVKKIMEKNELKQLIACSGLEVLESLIKYQHKLSNSV